MLIEHMRSTALPSGQSTCMTVVYNKDNLRIRHIITGKIKHALCSPISIDLVFLYYGKSHRLAT